MAKNTMTRSDFTPQEAEPKTLLENSLDSTEGAEEPFDIRSYELKITKRIFKKGRLNVPLFIKDYDKYTWPLEEIGSFLYLTLQLMLSLEYVYTELEFDKQCGEFSQAMMEDRQTWPRGLHRLIDEEQCLNQYEPFFYIRHAWWCIDYSMQSYILHPEQANLVVSEYWHTYALAQQSIGWLYSRSGAIGSFDRTGKIGAKKDYIKKLKEDNPDTSNKVLYEMADKEIIGEISYKTFSNIK